MFSELGGILHFSFRSGRGRKLSGDQITLPTTVDYTSVPKQVIASVVGEFIDHLTELLYQSYRMYLRKI